MIRRPPRSTLLSLHDALPIFGVTDGTFGNINPACARNLSQLGEAPAALRRRSEEHTSELQSQSNLVCRLLLEKKKKKKNKLDNHSTIDSTKQTDKDLR